MKVTIPRSDFRDVQDGPEITSLFRCLLQELKIPMDKWDDIDEVELEVIDFSATDIDGEEIIA